MPTLTQNMITSAEALMPDLMWSDINETGDDSLLKALPLGYQDADMVKWDQYDNPWGQLPLRGLDAAPDLVTMSGLQTKTVSPGYYGGVTQLLESEMTSERQPGTLADPLDVQNRLMILMQGFATMTVSRLRQTAADLLLTGAFTNVNTTGSIRHSYRVANYNQLSPANDGVTGPGWAASPSTATPINDLQYWQNLLQTGTSSSFGPDSTLLCQQSVVNDLLKTTQVQQTYRSQYGSSFLGLEGLNKLLMGMGLPKLEIYNKGYYPTLADALAKTNFTRVLPVKSLIWIGSRPKGQQIGQFPLTRHAGLADVKNGNYPEVPIENRSQFEWAQGLYVRAHFHNRMPHHYDIEMGFNASPILWYASATAGITYA